MLIVYNMLMTMLVSMCDASGDASGPSIVDKVEVMMLAGSQLTGVTPMFPTIDPSRSPHTLSFEHGN